MIGHLVYARLSMSILLLHRSVNRHRGRRDRQIPPAIRTASRSTTQEQKIHPPGF